MSSVPVMPFSLPGNPTTAEQHRMLYPPPPWHDHFRPFLSGLCLRPILLSPVLFLLVICYTGVGSEYGLPEQIYHEDWLAQAFGGLAASMLLLQVGIIAYLLDAEMSWVAQVPPRPGDLSHRIDRQMRWYLDRTWVPLTGLVGLAALLAPAERWPFILGLVVPLVVYLIRISRWFTQPSDETQPEPPTLALFQPTTTPPRIGLVRVEVILHVVIAAVGVTLIGLLIPNTHLRLLCFVLTWWVALHGVLLFLFRLHTMPNRDHRRMHRRAGVAFGLFFAFYQVLFVLYCLNALPGYLGSPIVLTMMLLCQIVTIHGFLRYHFRSWYVLVLLKLLIVIGLINGTPRHKLHFPGLNYDVRVQLLEADFEGLYAQLLKRTSDLEDDPENEDQLNLVMAGYHRITEAHRSLDQRYQERRERAGLPPESLPCSDNAPEAVMVADLLKRQRFSEAYQCFQYWKDTTDEVGVRLARLEYSALEEWKKRTAPEGKKPKLAVISVSGGANRSALWTTLVLDQLERAFRQEHILFPRHVRVMTGASGGMVGAAYWVSTLDEERSLHREDSEQVIRPVSQECLTPLTHHALFLDLPTLLLPGEFKTDRGVALEQAWSKNMAGSLDRPFRSLATSEYQGSRPSLIFSPMLVEDGRRLLISNLYLPFLTESAGESLANPDRQAARPGTVRTKRPRPSGKSIKYDPDMPRSHLARQRRDRYSLSAVEFFQLFPLAEQFPLSTAVRMSATFPYFSPAVDLPTEPRRRVVDAGYYDNYGINIAAAWIYHYRRWLEKNTSGVVLIQVRDGASERRKLFADHSPPFWDMARTLEWVTGPLVGLGSAREAGMSFRNDEMVQVLSDHFNHNGRPMFTTVVFEAQADIAMSWYLTRQEISEMKSSLGQDGTTLSPNRRAVDRLISWWKKDHSQAVKPVARGAAQ
ncbi:MAG: patatin-like phospholipase family protein [Gemmataceae bacterium]